MLAERALEVQKDMYICYIDYTKAFDKVKHEQLFDILEKLDLDGKDLRVIRNLYGEQSACIRIGNDFSQYKMIQRGVRQGCVFSPDLFNIYSETIMRELEELEGLIVGGRNSTNMRYADDTAIIATSEEKLQALLDKVVEESRKMGLSINIKKTESMVISKSKIHPRCNLNVEGNNIKQVEKFNYLGSLITDDGRCDAEIRRRIGIAKETFHKMQSILKDRKMPMTTKIRILHCYIYPVLCYGCECWTISKPMIDRVQAAEIH
uniref:ribonuclease H n=1 Tax=Amphiprion ocellaris TaxID=80972 RepID=A0AAQ6A1U7_AMPOC